MINKKNLKNTTGIKTELTKKLGHEPNKVIWDYLVKEEWVQDVILVDNKISAFSKLYKQYQDQEKRSLNQKLSSKQHIEPPDERLKYLSNILASDLDKEPLIINFRHEVLSDKLLDPKKVDYWIKGLGQSEHSDISSNIIRHIRVRLPVGIDLLPTKKVGWETSSKVIISNDMIEGVEVALLSYIGPGGTLDIQHVRVPQGGILERLYNLSKSFSGEYPFDEAYITFFILTGIIPLLPLAQSTCSYKSRYPEASTITMKLSLHLSPEEVKQLYFRARRAITGEKQKRDRAMIRKHLELAEFYHNHKDIRGANMMTKWNKLYPSYSYKEVTNFLRDAKHAHDRLVGWDA